MLSLHFLGETRLLRDGAMLELPPSRKTRALLAYLAVTGRPHRRERLCSLLWDLPDDPRGALRWSLSKLRVLVNEPGAARIVANRETVRFDPQGAHIDILDLRRCASGGLKTAATDDLASLAERFGGEFLVGLEFPDSHEFHAWCIAERAESRALQVRILRTLISRLESQPEAALPHARALVAFDTDEVSTHVVLLRLLLAAGRLREAEEQRELSARLLGEAGANAMLEFDRAWGSLAGRMGGGNLAGGRLSADLGTWPVYAAKGSGEAAVSSTGEVLARTEGIAESERRRIAVLPFTSMSDDGGDEYFADGVTEDIITDLSQVSALFVVARNTAFTYKGKAVEVTEAAQQLNVGYILQGSVRKAANRIRINVQLIDGLTGDHLWSQRYDRDFGDIFALQDEISKSVVVALKVNLLPEELRSIADRATTNAEAYECYLQGRSFLFGGFGDKHSLREARGMFSKAIEIDPGYARAYAGIAECDALLWMSGGSDISYEEILRNSTIALTFMPNLAEAHASKGLALFLSGRHKEAMIAFDRAIEMDAELFEAHEWYGEVCRNTGQFAKAAALFERAGELRPTDYVSQMLLRDCYGSLGLQEQSLAAAKRAFVRIEARLMKHPYDAMAICTGAATLVSLGEYGQAEAWASRALALSPEDYLVHYNAACTYAVTGRSDAAVERLEHIFSHAPRVRPWLLGIVRHDVQLDSLRDRPDFQSFVNRLQFDASAEPDNGHEPTPP